MSETRPLVSPLIEKAMRVAVCWHRDQLRKGTDIPYITHPASVALILNRAGFNDERILAAALLHDVVEDTDYTTERLAAEFPADVVELVTALTERKTTTSGEQRSWQDRKEEHLQQIAHASAEACAIVLADKLHNLSTMLFDFEAGEAVWSRFSAPPEKIVWYYRNMIERAEAKDDRLAGLAATCRELLARLQATL